LRLPTSLHSNPLRGDLVSVPKLRQFSAFSLSISQAFSHLSFHYTDDCSRRKTCLDKTVFSTLAEDVPLLVWFPRAAAIACIAAAGATTR
jgi:hypothetical protein